MDLPDLCRPVRSIARHGEINEKRIRARKLNHLVGPLLHRESCAGQLRAQAGGYIVQRRRAGDHGVVIGHAVNDERPDLIHAWRPEQGDDGLPVLDGVTACTVHRLRETCRNLIKCRVTHLGRVLVGLAVEDERPDRALGHVAAK